MQPYLLTLLIHILTFSFAYKISNNLTLSLLINAITSTFAIYYFKKEFKLKLSLNPLAILTGLIIAFLWIVIDPYYKALGTPGTGTFTAIDIILKLYIGVVLAAIIEEYFTRFFLLRWLIKEKWQKVKEATYTHTSFIGTVLFFGLAHNRWLSGLISGILFNLLYYKTKKIDTLIMAHAISNLALGLYVIYTGNYSFWLS